MKKHTTFDPKKRPLRRHMTSTSRYRLRFWSRRGVGSCFRVELESSADFNGNKEKGESHRIAGANCSKEWKFSITVCSMLSKVARRQCSNAELFGQKAGVRGSNWRQTQDLMERLQKFRF